MIKTIIFDFGDVFINLDKQGAINHALSLFELEEFPEDLIAINVLYEQGLIDTNEFLDFYSNNFPKISKEDIINAWNYIIKDFPKYRLLWLQELLKEKKYKIILLSNTNSLHINYIKAHVPFYEDFKNCFDAFYLSHEIQMRKPNKGIFEFVIKMHNLTPNECLFVDDTKENTDSAKTIGFHVWNINEHNEDVITLFETLKAMF